MRLFVVLFSIECLLIVSMILANYWRNVQKAFLIMRLINPIPPGRVYMPRP